MHNAAYKALGVKWEYGFADRETEADARVFLNVRNWRALNVTMPWKRLAFEMADARTDAAKLAQGANTLVNWGGRIYADNTDGRGCIAYLRRCGATFAGARVVVCGTGPTSLAIMHACAASGASRVVLLGRNADKAQQALEAYEEHGGAGGRAEMIAGSYGESASAIAQASVIIDATPLGMNPNDPAPFSVGLLSSRQTVLDVVYGHGETALIAAARATGCQAHDGAGMLVAQAVETVKTIAAVTGAFTVPAHMDLFAIMAEAAGFEFGGQ